MMDRGESDAASLPRLVLSVSRSVCNRPWRSRLDAKGDARALQLVQLNGCSNVLARLLAARNVSPDQVGSYLDPALRDLMPDPARLADMTKAVGRIADAIALRKKIAILGDYDVDGAASAALLATFLKVLGTPHVIYIPDRLFEGYGPNIEAVRSLKADGAELLVCVDCGTTSHLAIAEADSLGLAPIILDHHLAPEQLPPALVVNPNRLDDLSGLGRLCAAGVVFMLLVALRRELRVRGVLQADGEPDLLAFLDLVALATVADVAPLTGLNRAFVKKGLSVMRLRLRPGLAALFDVAGADGPPTTTHLGFLLGPRINAGGRIGDAALGARLLSLDDQAEASAIAAKLNELNRERQALEAAMFAEADAEASRQIDIDGEADGVIVVGSTSWHPGIVGIIAGRLRERYARPAFAIAMSEASGTGSGRSIPGVNLGSAVAEAVSAGVLLKGGGHAMAAGITLGPSGIDGFRTFIAAAIDEASRRAQADDVLDIDATLTAGAADMALLADLEKAGPFGSGSPEPVFAFPHHRLLDASVVGKDHVRFRIDDGGGNKLNGIAFKAAGSDLGRTLLSSRGEAMHFAGSLLGDRFGGRERARLQLRDIARVAQALPGSAS